MYWDNNSIADYYASKAYHYQLKFEEVRNAYINDLYVVDATFDPDERAYVDGDKANEFTPECQEAWTDIDEAIWNANKLIDPEMDVDEDFYLDMFQKGDSAHVCGMVTEEGFQLIYEVFEELKNFGTVKFTFK